MMKKLLALALSVLLCICITPQKVLADTQYEIIDEIDLTDTLPDNFGFYGGNNPLMGYFYSKDFGDLTLYNEYSCVYCYELVEETDGTESYHKLIYDTSFSIGGKYAIELILKAPEGSLFKCEYNESKDCYEYTGSFLPSVDDSKFIVGDVDYSEQEGYSIVSSPNPSCISIFIPFTVEPVLINVNSWSDMESKIIELGNYSSSAPVTFKLTQDITATDANSAFELWEPMNITVDLNGHVINRNLINADGTKKYRPVKEGNEGQTYTDYQGSIFELHSGDLIGCNLTIKDSNPNVKHNGYVDENGLWHLESNGHPTAKEKSKTIKGGIITGGIGFRDPEYDGGKGVEYGGAIFIRGYNDNVVFDGGTICGNTVDGFGGGVAAYLYDSSDIIPEKRLSFIMNNGSTICNNVASCDGAGIISLAGIIEINDGHIDDNHSGGSGGGFFGTNMNKLVIKSGTINNNSANVNGGAISIQENYPDVENAYLSLTADPDKNIEITGNKSFYFGAVFADTIFNVSGAVVIKDNTCNLEVVDTRTGGEPEKDENGNYLTIDPNTGEPYRIFYNHVDDVYIVNSDAQTVLNVVGPLTGSDIVVSTHMDFLYPQEYIPVTINYLANNPGSNIDDFIHYGGSNQYYLNLKDDGDLYITETPVENTAVLNDESFKDAIQDAISSYEDQEDHTNYKIEISDNIGSEEPLGELFIPENVELELNGNDIYVDGSIFIQGEILDSGGEDESGNPVKGKIFMKDPEDLVYNYVVEAELDAETCQEPVWTEIDDPTSNMNGYYCMYKVGANTKWAEAEEGSGLWKKGQDKAKFKIQPTAYEELANGLTQVYGADTIVKVGIRVSLIKNDPKNPTQYDFGFKESLLSDWITQNNPTLNNKCISVNMSGLKSYSNVGAQAAIYSKVKPTNNFDEANAPFISKLRLADDSEE